MSKQRKPDGWKKLKQLLEILKSQSTQMRHQLHQRNHDPDRNLQNQMIHKAQGEILDPPLDLKNRAALVQSLDHDLVLDQDQGQDLVRRSLGLDQHLRIVVVEVQANQIQTDDLQLIKVFMNYIHECYIR